MTGSELTCGHEDLFESLYAGALDEREEADARRTVESCLVCRRRLDALLATPDARAGLAAAERGIERAVATVGARSKAPRSWRAPWLAAAAIILASFAGLLVYRTLHSEQTVAELPSGGVAIDTPQPPTTTPKRDWRSVPVRKAPYTNVPIRQATAPKRVYRGGDDGPPLAPPVVALPKPSEFEIAMQNYIREDFAKAATTLAPLAARGDVRASFYQGVSLMLLGRDTEAIDPLSAAASAKFAPKDISAQAHIYLAIAYLHTDREDLARAELHTVETAGGAVGAYASALQQEIDKQ